MCPYIRTIFTAVASKKSSYYSWLYLHELMPIIYSHRKTQSLKVHLRVSSNTGDGVMWMMCVEGNKAQHCLMKEQNDNIKRFEMVCLFCSARSKTIFWWLLMQWTLHSFPETLTMFPISQTNPDYLLFNSYIEQFKIR